MSNSCRGVGLPAYRQNKKASLARLCRPGGLHYIALLLSVPAFAQISGTVVNESTGRPQPGATVGIYTMGNKNGLELVDQAKSDAQGKFTVAKDLPGMLLMRTAFGGITYNHRLSPTDPRTNLSLEVYDVSKQPGAAKVGKHMLLFEPTGEQMAVTETFLLTNNGKSAWYDPDAGTLRIYAPANGSKPTVQGTAPGGAPIGAALVKTTSPDIWGVDFAVKPGETRFDVSYTVPYKDGETYSGKVPSKDENTYVIVPQGVEIKAEGLNDLGAEPRTQAHIWGLTGNTYKIALTGSVAPAQPEASAESNDAGPKIEAMMPRLYKTAPYILVSALGVLALGFALLYRASPDRGTK
jgi:hypothetical protein